MTSEPQQIPPSRRLWLRFSLLGMLLMTSLIAVAIWAVREHRERIRLEEVVRTRGQQSTAVGFCNIFRSSWITSMPSRRSVHPEVPEVRQLGKSPWCQLATGCFNATNPRSPLLASTRNPFGDMIVLLSGRSKLLTTSTSAGGSLGRDRIIEARLWA
jgi:hypothetical protein